MPEPARALRVGLISDTHGLSRSEALDALQGSDHIVHGGDIVDPQILATLAAIAPLTAVRGNNDRGPWAEALPETALIELGGLRLFVLHDLKTMAIDPVARGIDVVVAGHSHRPHIERRDGVLFVNPGSAGPRRFSLPVSLARLTVADGRAEAELIRLL